jgi:hypothetical protein
VHGAGVWWVVRRCAWARAGRWHVHGVPARCVARVSYVLLCHPGDLASSRRAPWVRGASRRARFLGAVACAWGPLGVPQVCARCVSSYPLVTSPLHGVLLGCGVLLGARVFYGAGRLFALNVKEGVARPWLAWLHARGWWCSLEIGDDEFHHVRHTQHTSVTQSYYVIPYRRITL